MRIERVVPNLTVANTDDAVEAHRAVLGWSVLMDHGWIVTLGDDAGHQLSVMTRDASAAVNPDVSIFVDDVHAALRRAHEAGAEIVHPLTEEPWGVTRFFYRGADGKVSPHDPNWVVDCGALITTAPPILRSPRRSSPDGGHDLPSCSVHDAGRNRR